MELGIEHLRGAVAKLREFWDKDYAIAFITGSGLGEILDMDHVHFEIPYSQIPFFPVSTVEGHLGKLIGGDLLGKVILLFKGRFHLYEGYSPSHIAFPIWVSKLLGAKYLFITSASGGLNLEFRPGDLMLIKDHINLTGKNPLTGPNIEELGPRFPDMTAAYDPSLQSLAREVANAIGLPLKEGVYVAVHGPSLETPAETRFLRSIGADAVGMSTVPEVITAVHCGMKVLAIALICNINDPDHMKKIDFEEVLRVAEMSTPHLRRFWKELIGRLDPNA